MLLSRLPMDIHIYFISHVAELSHIMYPWNLRYFFIDSRVWFKNTLCAYNSPLSLWFTNKFNSVLLNTRVHVYTYRHYFHYFNTIELYDASVVGWVIVNSIRDMYYWVLDGKIIFYVGSDDSQVFIQFSLTVQLNLIYFHDRMAACCVLCDGDRPPSNSDECM